MNKISPKDIKVFLEGAQKEDLDVIISVAIHCYEGIGMDKDLSLAFECYKKAAEYGHKVAQCDLAFLYREGLGTRKNIKEAVYWYEKSAEQGFGDAQLELGVLYHNGNGIEKDLEKCIYWYKKAAEQGDQKAKFNLGQMAINGEGMDINIPWAIDLFKESAEGGCAEAQYNLGIILTRGEWVDRDTKAARYWFKKAADQGMDAAADALARLDEIEGPLTSEKPEVPSDKMNDLLQKLVQTLKEHADNGDVDAQYRLGIAYNDGDDATGLDLEKANRYFRMAAEQGHMQAQCNLGVNYLYGCGIEKDMDKGRYWLEKAAAQGDYIASIHLDRLDRGENDYYDRPFSSYAEYQAIYGHEAESDTDDEDEEYEYGDDEYEDDEYEDDEYEDDEYEDDEYEEYDNYDDTSASLQQESSSPVVSLEKIFSADEAIACFRIGADIVRYEGGHLLPPSVFLFYGDEDSILIYKDLMMYGVYALGIRSESNWNQIYLDSENHENLANAVDIVSSLSEAKKKFASVFLRKIATSDADMPNLESRLSQYHKYCIQCNLEELSDDDITNSLLIFMQKANGYNYIPDPDMLTFEANGIEFNMIRVEGGSFEMGSEDPETFEDGASLDDAPIHDVTVGSFYIGETMVTEELWGAVMNTDVEECSESYPMLASWYDCQEFVKRLSSLMGIKFRLPTEAEWEFAARGGNESIGYIYSGSDDIEDVAWYEENSEGYLHEVAELDPNGLGIYDMSGNLYEWCQDWYDEDYYSYSPEDNPTGPEDGTEKVVRGGSSLVPDYACRVDIRGGLDPQNGSVVGLRLVMDFGVVDDNQNE